jgi:HEAT repeat protein
VAAFKPACKDANSSVRLAAVLALGDLKDKSLVDFYKQIFDKDASPRVRAEALRALGKAGDPAVVPFLRQASSVPSRQNMVKRAAEGAIKQLETK